MYDEKLALYTTIYPGVEPFLCDWKQSILNQEDRNVDIWVGVDGFSSTEAKHLLLNVNVKEIVMNDYPYSKAIRRNALAEIVDIYFGVVLADSDDILKRTRVSAARKYLRSNDVVGCAMNLVDREGNDLQICFGEISDILGSDSILHFNRYGLSNTAYRSALLKKCLDVPDTELVDWFFITYALALEAKIFFDPVERMYYRQHFENLAKIIPPFSNDYILIASNIVIRHYYLVLKYIEILTKNTRERIIARMKTIERFYSTISNDSTLLNEYVFALNKLPCSRVWWHCVANSQLETIWNQ